MVIALMALAGFQGYWMWQAWEMQSEIFDRQVKEAMLETVERIEKAEVKYLAKQREAAEAKKALLQAQRRKQETRLAHDTPSKTRIMPGSAVNEGSMRDGEVPSWIATEQAFFRQMAEAEEAFWQSVGLQLPGMLIRENILSDLDALVSDPANLLVPREDTIRRVKPQLVRRKADMVREVFTDLVDEKRTTAERVNRSMVDTVLSTALRQRGISMDFEVGVKEKQHVVFASYPLQTDPQRWQAAYQVPLFSDEAHLFAHFPEKEQYLWKKLRALLASSLLLFGAFGVIIYLAADTLWQQKKLSVEKSEFISNMTHEFKTPITTISLAIQALTDRTVHWSAEVRERYLGVISQENRRLREQVEKVLQSATLEKGNIGIHPQEVAVGSMFEEIRQSFLLRLEANEGTLTLAGDLGGTLWVDPVHFRNMVSNLIDNACKYTVGAPRIQLGYEVRGRESCVWVQDAGLGIPEDQVDRVFDQFYRVPTGNVHNVKGFGLGLYYVRKMMEAHQGRWQISSQLGQGTRIELYFQQSV